MLRHDEYKALLMRYWEARQADWRGPCLFWQAQAPNAWASADLIQAMASFDKLILTLCQQSDATRKAVRDICRNNPDLYEKAERVYWRAFWRDLRRANMLHYRPINPTESWVY